MVEIHVFPLMVFVRLFTTTRRLFVVCQLTFTKTKAFTPTKLLRFKEGFNKDLGLHLVKNSL